VSFSLGTRTPLSVSRTDDYNLLETARETINLFGGLVLSVIAGSSVLANGWLLVSGARDPLPAAVVVCLSFALLTVGLVAIPDVRQWLSDRTTSGGTGQTRTVDHRVVESPAESCVVCNDRSTVAWRRDGAGISPSLGVHSTGRQTTGLTTVGTVGSTNTDVWGANPTVNG
jgi:hypothetical protein